MTFQHNEINAILQVPLTVGRVAFFSRIEPQMNMLGYKKIYIIQPKHQKYGTAYEGTTKWVTWAQGNIHNVDDLIKRNAMRWIPPDIKSKFGVL